MDEQFLRTRMILGADAVERLRCSHVIVFGLGGVGSYAAEALARAGVGELTLVDQDTLSVSNINRQLYALHSTVGMYKADVAALTSTPRCGCIRSVRRMTRRTGRISSLRGMTISSTPSTS